MSVPNAETLLADFKRFPLLTPSQFARVEAATRTGAHPPEQVVRRLVEKGWLTKYQGEAVLGGRTYSLMFGPYILLDKLGEGGMGSVYKARHRRLGRIDAVKVIRPDKIASKVVARRFLREIRLTSDLHHQHVVRAVDAGEVGRQWYLATQFVQGVDLATVVRRLGPLPVPDACLAIYQASLALQHVHERGLVHRDVKPSNLIREDQTGRVKLLDLGLSRFREPTGQESMAGTLTTDGVLLGTPDFMAPEQAVDPHGVDIRADLYALGCTFFFLLTGRPPYTGSSVDKLLAHSSSSIPPVQLPGGPTPPALNAIVARLMAKRPEDRYPTPQALTDALLALRPGNEPPSAGPSATVAPPESHPAPVVDEWQSAFHLLVSQTNTLAASPLTKRLPSPSPASRLRWLWVTVATLAILVVVALVVSRGRPRGTLAVESPPDHTQLGSPAVPEDAPAEELRALQKALDTPGEDRGRLRDRVIAFRTRRVGTPLAIGAAELLRRLPSPLDQLSPTPGPDGGISSIQVGKSGAPVLWFQFGPSDRRLLVARRGGQLEEWSLPTLEESGRFMTPSAGPGRTATVSADGRTVVTARPDGVLCVWSERGGLPREIDLGPGFRARVVGVGAAGRAAVVAFTDGDKRLGRIDLETGRMVGQLDHRSMGVNGITVSPDGEACLVSSDHDILREIPQKPGRSTRQFEPGPGTRGGSGAGVYGPDGLRLYLTGVETAAGRFPAGAVTADIRYEVLAARSMIPFTRPRQTFQPPTCVAVSADEVSVAVGTHSGVVRVFAAGSGTPTQEFTLSGPVGALAFSTHGRVLAVGLGDGSVLLVPLKG
jgi:serine/threonine protein kinase